MTIQKPAGGTPVVGAKVTLRDTIRAVIGVGRTDATGKVEFNVPALTSKDINPEFGFPVPTVRKGIFAQIHGTGFTTPVDVAATGTYTATFIFVVDPPTAATNVPVAPQGAGWVIT